ncbi:hypothetical protein [Sinomonas susongensis]|uniref:hypothetical protein n=1 Tax=Sinomonas susongensis TaxID=1324851 RepID=UPI001108D844|nr:hypothetical protein [Sinomonas susongensis]
MGFFPPAPDAAPERPLQPRPPEWLAPPSLEMPAVVPLGAILAQTGRVTLAVESARVFHNGATFEIRCVRRRTNESSSEWEAGAHDRAWTGRPGSGGPRFGILYPDGSKTLADTQPAEPFPPPRAPQAVLRRVHSSGSGGDRERTAQLALWLWPLPDPGPHRLFTEWQAAGIPESSLEFDGALLRAGARGARPYWT